LNYNLANLYYENGEQRKALRSLNIINISDVFDNLDARVLLIKVYFDQHDYEGAYTSIVAARAYVKRVTALSNRQI
jgi:hypothetical protein